MKRSKVKALEDAGWTVGSTEDLLGLSDDEMLMIDMKISLAKKFQALRKKTKLTQVQVAKLLHTSQSRVAKMESGDASVSMDLLVKGLLSLGANKKDVGKALAAH